MCLQQIPLGSCSSGITKYRHSHKPGINQGCFVNNLTWNVKVKEWMLWTCAVWHVLVYHEVSPKSVSVLNHTSDPKTVKGAPSLDNQEKSCASVHPWNVIYLNLGGGGTSLSRGTQPFLSFHLSLGNTGMFSSQLRYVKLPVCPSECACYI